MGSGAPETRLGYYILALTKIKGKMVLSITCCYEEIKNYADGTGITEPDTRTFLIGMS